MVAITLAALCLSFWARGVVPEAWSALLFLLLASILNVASTTVVFSGFAFPTFWLFFLGLVLSSAMTHTGLGTAISPLVGRVMGAISERRWWGCVFGHGAGLCPVPRLGLVGATCLKDDIGLGGLLFLAGLLGVGAVVAGAGGVDTMTNALETLPDVRRPKSGVWSSGRVCNARRDQHKSCVHSGHSDPLGRNAGCVFRP